MKPVSLIKMLLNKTYNIVRVGKHFYDTFPIQNEPKKGFDLPHCFSSLI
jgi:hypothetical protein